MTNIITLFFLIVIFIYIFLLRKIHNTNIPSVNLSDLLYKKTETKFLFIFPHPDDETFNCGGLINKLNGKTNIYTKCISVTRGEKGNELLKLNPKSIASVRKKEYKSALNRLGNVNYEIWDLPDGELANMQHILYKKIKNHLKHNHYDYIITYDLSGLYGHPDHTTLTQTLIQVIKNNNLNPKLIFTDLPIEIKNYLNLPIQMATKEIVNIPPTFRVNIIYNVYNKFKALKTFRSQNLGWGRPLWIFALFGIWEYYRFPTNLN